MNWCCYPVFSPLQYNRFSMQVIIPNPGRTLKGLLRALKSTSVEFLRKNMKEPGDCDKVHLYLPKFKIEATFPVGERLRQASVGSMMELQGEIKVDVLLQMGATDMFSEDDANFSGIPEDPTTKLFMSEMVQKSVIAVDEEGTEAAAATGFFVDPT